MTTGSPEPQVDAADPGAARDAAARLHALHASPDDRRLLRAYADAQPQHRRTAAVAAALRTCLTLSPGTPHLLSLYAQALQPEAPRVAATAFRRAAVVHEAGGTLRTRALLLLNELGMHDALDHAADRLLEDHRRETRTRFGDGDSRSAYLLAMARLARLFPHAPTLRRRRLAVRMTDNRLHATLPQGAPPASPAGARLLDRSLERQILGLDPDVDRAFKVATASQPETAGLWFAWACFVHEEKRYGDAVPLYRRAMRFTRHCPVLANRLAHCLANLGRFDAAGEQYAAILAIEPSGIPGDARPPRTGLGLAAPAIVDPAPLFSTVIATRDRLDYLRQALTAHRRQTYRRFEVVVVTNGSPPALRDYVDATAAADPRFVPIHIAEPQSTPDDPLRYAETCLNEGLRRTRGSFVFHHSDDDWIAPDYVERMVALFGGNPDCIAASGAISRIDGAGDYQGTYDHMNERPAYTPGLLVSLAHYLSWLPLSRLLYGAFGHTFAFRREVQLAAGGHHRDMDTAVLLGILPFGLTGFDPAARLHWRVHEGQHSTQLNASGLLDSGLGGWAFDEGELRRRLAAIGPDLADKLIGAWNRQHVVTVLKAIARPDNRRRLTDPAELDRVVARAPDLAQSDLYRLAMSALERDRHAKTP